MYGKFEKSNMARINIYIYSAGCLLKLLPSRKREASRKKGDSVKLDDTILSGVQKSITPDYNEYVVHERIYYSFVSLRETCINIYVYGNVIDTDIYIEIGRNSIKRL